MAGLEGRTLDAINGFRDAIGGFTHLGVLFDAALATIDLATVLGEGERALPEVAILIDAAHATLTRLGARPFLARLDAVLARGGDAGPPMASGRTAPRTTSSVR